MDTGPAGPRVADLEATEDFERKRCGFFADEYHKTSLYWSSLCDLMGENDGSTQQMLDYIAGKLETDRVYTASIYANADKVFGDKKGAAKLRHDKIRHTEQKAKLKGETPPVMEDALKAGGAGKEPPASGTLMAIWEMTEMDCRAARHRDVLCDELEMEHLLGRVKAMGKDTNRRFKELAEEGNACLLSLRNIDRRVGLSFLHLKETLGGQIGGKALHEDVWFLDCRYRTAVVHQTEAWNAVSTKMREVFNQMKNLEAERRDVLRDFMIGANVAIGNSWSMLRTLCGPACDSANAVDASEGAVDRDVKSRALSGVEEKKRSSKDIHLLPNTTNSVYATPIPSSMSFVESLTAPLESPMVRAMMMVERREGKAIGSKYYPGLMVLTWDGFIHFFDVPSTSSLKKDASPAAAFQDISPTISLDDLVANKKDLEEVLLFKSTVTLQLTDEAVVEAVSSHKSHKIEVKGSAQVTSIKRHFGSGTSLKTVTFRATSEAEMNHALNEIKDCIHGAGGMVDKDGNTVPSARQSMGSRSSFGSNRSDTSSAKQVSEPEQAQGPAPSFMQHSSMNSNSSVGSAAPAAADPAPAPPAAAAPAPPAAEEASAEAVVAMPVAEPVVTKPLEEAA